MMKRPKRVIIFCWGSIIFSIIGAISFIISKYFANQPTPSSALPDFMTEVNLILGTGITIYCGLKMLKAEIKARTVYLGYMVYTLIISIIVFSTMDYSDIIAASQGTLSKEAIQAMYLLNGSIPILITLLCLYTPKSNKWFKKSTIVEQNNLTAQSQDNYSPINPE